MPVTPGERGAAQPEGPKLVRDLTDADIDRIANRLGATRVGRGIQSEGGNYTISFDGYETGEDVPGQLNGTIQVYGDAVLYGDGAVIFVKPLQRTTYGDLVHRITARRDGLIKTIDHRNLVGSSEVIKAAEKAREAWVRELSQDGIRAE